MQSAIDSGIRARWIELTPDSHPWPCDFANAQNVIIQVPDSQKRVRVSGGRAQFQLGTVTAEATLEANGIQDLAEQIPGITMAAVGSNLKFNIRIELSGDDAPDPATIEAINSLLSNVSEELKLR